MTETSIDSIEECIKYTEKHSRLVADVGYNVVALRFCFNKDGTAYPHLTNLQHCKTWEEAKNAAENLTRNPPMYEDRVIVLPTTKRATEPSERGVFTKVLDDIEFHAPKKGYNLCSLDCFEEVGEQLYLIGHYATYEEAVQAKKVRCGESRGDGYYIYPWNREVEPE